MATGRLPDPNSAPVTAKGDLYTYSTRPERLAVGSNGDTLVADSSTSTGLRWQGSTAAGRNYVLNGGMDIWQRGTSFSLAASTSAANGFSADRWQTVTGANQACTLSRQATGDTTNLPNIQYCLRYQRNSGQTGTSGALALTQSFETVNSIPLAGRTVTLSFYARAGANFSATSSALNVYLISGTGTDQNRAYGASYTGEAYPINNQTATLTTTWQRFSFTGTVAATATELAIYTAYAPTGTAGAADYYEITGIQLEVGSVATQFTRSGGNIAGELAAASRYYFRWNAEAAYSVWANGYAYSTTACNFTIHPPAKMRVKPTSVDFSTIAATIVAVGTNGFTGLAIGNECTADVITVQATGATGLTQYRPYSLSANNSTSAYIGFSAEL